MIGTYILRRALWPLVASVSTLGFLALMTQSVSTLDLIIDQRQSLFTYLRITVLAMPQLIALILPLALFLAVIYAVNRLQSDSELVVCAAAGMSKRAIASPLMKLAIGALIVNLAVNLWVQPYAFREMRQQLYEVRGDLAAKLVRPGQFRSASEGLTIYARDMERGGQLTDLLIEDATDEERPVTYLARSGVFTEVRGEPMLLLYDGSIQSIDENHQLSFLRFDSYQFQLDAFVEETGPLFYKLSDRYLDQLFFPDAEDEWAIRYRPRLLAEAHYRLAAPLYAPALVLIALAAVLGGEFSRTGYARRIAIAAAAALGVRLVGFGVESWAVDNAAVNPLQYAVPVLAMIGGARALFTNPQDRRKRPPRLRRGEVAPAGAAAEASPA